LIKLSEQLRKEAEERRVKLMEEFRDKQKRSHYAVTSRSFYSGKLLIHKRVFFSLP